MATPLNRSLERGAEILRAFRPGSTLLGNGELAERTGLAPATVSRLTQTLVASGLLDHDRAARAYRLAPAVLSLAHAMRAGSELLPIAAPRMRALAEKLRINVGLATADRTEMVYLESIRAGGRPSLRTVVSGQRVPIELTSLGRAWLAAAPERERSALLKQLAQRRADWATLKREIAAAIEQVQRVGWCAASWQPEVVAVATPLLRDNERVYVLNASVSWGQAGDAITAELSGSLISLAREIARAFEGRVG